MRYMYYVDEMSRLPLPFENETCPYIEDLPHDGHRNAHGDVAPHPREDQVAWHSYPFTSKRRKLQEQLETLSSNTLNALEGTSLQWDLRGLGLKGWGYGGWGGFIVLYDHFQEGMAAVVLGGKKKSTVIQEVGRRRMDEEIWGDSDNKDSSPYLR